MWSLAQLTLQNPAQRLAHGGINIYQSCIIEGISTLGTSLKPGDRSCHGRQPGLPSNRPLGTMVGDRILVWIDQGSVLEGYFYLKHFLKTLTFYISSSCWSTYSTNTSGSPTLGSALFLELESQQDREPTLLWFASSFGKSAGGNVCRRLVSTSGVSTVMTSVINPSKSFLLQIQEG